MEKYVIVNQLVKMYGDFCAVDHLSFEIGRGEIYGLLGPNGAGKSTTLSIITTLNKFDKGTVTVDGYDIVRDSKKIRSFVGVVPQDIAVYRHLSAYENVRFFARLYGMKKEEIDHAVCEALDFVGLGEKHKMKPGQMSGGMQRRLNIACGIVHHPKLIVMDEPTVGVDAQSRDHILNSVRILNKQGATIIYTSHYMQEVEELCDHIAIVDHGKLVAKGTKDELVALVTDVKPFVIDTRCITQTDAEKICSTMKSLPNVVNVKASDRQIRMDLSIKSENIYPYIEKLASMGFPILNVTSENPNLDTTYLCLTGKELR